MGNFTIHKVATDVLIIGGGTAGCFSAITLAERSRVQVIVAEKADIRRSGCLAAGVNALNAYIVKGQTPEDYLDYVRADSAGVIREDLVYSIAKNLNQVTKKLEKLGLVIQKNAQGEYVARGKRNLKINGENIKAILAQAVRQSPNVTVLNRVNMIDYIMKKDQIIGAYGFSLEGDKFYVISAKAVICATGGAAGLYRPNNPGFSRHKLWYCPFNTGAGYSMGIRAGAEMTTFEMRFIALRCKDTIAPTGTIAQGVGAPQINRLGEAYEANYDSPTTATRIYSTVTENKQGRGPCYLQTAGIATEQQQSLYKAYLNMAPSQTLRWIESGRGLAEENVEIEGTEPYVVGGHTGSGYWIDTQRATTLAGLYAAGDVAGGSPQKYVTGCLAEGEIAAAAALEYSWSQQNYFPDNHEIDQKLAELNALVSEQPDDGSCEAMEEAMQTTMDTYAGGIATGYAYGADNLQIAKEHIDRLIKQSSKLRTNTAHGIMQIYEVIDRLYVCKILLCHLEARHETRWHAFQENSDYPLRDDEHWLKFVNTRYDFQQDKIEVLLRSLVKKDDIYEHKD